MADSNSGGPPYPNQRRKSFVEMLNPRAFSTSSSMAAPAPSSAIPVPSSPGASGSRKSMSMALGLSGSANSQDSPFNAFARQRRASISTSTASGSPEFRNSFDDNAVIEEDDKVGPINAPPSPSFARRLSFGAQALRDARQGGSSPGSVGNAGRRPSSSLFTLAEASDNTQANQTTPTARSPGTAKTGGEGFNWSDAMRDPNKRSSVSSANPFAGSHTRSKSVNAPIPEPPKEIPRAPQAPAITRTKKPDHLGERMLRGDFMMD